MPLYKGSMAQRTNRGRRIAALHMRGNHAPSLPKPPIGSEAAVALYRAVYAHFRSTPNPSREHWRLLEPLSQAVACQKTRTGQILCAQIGAALAAGDRQTALDQCRALTQYRPDLSDWRDAG